MSNRLILGMAVGACAALVLVAWLALAPAGLGGSVEYVTTNGDSMEPSFRDGDLALLRARESYAPGDIVAYRHPDHGLVLHRIVASDGETFIVKGDNNPMSDAYQPSSKEIVGAVWARVPTVGVALTGSLAQWLRIAAAVILGLFALIPLGIAFPDRARLSGRGFSGGAGFARPGAFAALLGRTGQTLAALLAFIAIVGLILAFVAYNHSLERQVVVPLEYEQRANLSYSAAPVGTVYTENVVNTGDPVYRALVEDLFIHLNHDLSTDAVIAGDGDYWIDAIVKSSDGWRHPIPLRTETRFTGTALTDTVVLPLDAVDDAIEAFRAQVGLEGVDDLAYMVHIQASVAFDGTIANEAVHTIASDEIILRWQPDALYLASQLSAEEAPLTGTVETTRTVGNSIELGFLSLDVRIARMMAQILLFLAVGGGLLLWFLTHRALKAPEPVQIAARYRSRIVPIQGAKLPAPTSVVALLSFDDLIRISDQKQEPILYFRRNGDHYYYVHAADVIYRVKIASDTDPDTETGDLVRSSNG